MSVFQLAYISFASDFFKKDSKTGVSDILEEAKEFNKENGITGMLLFRNGVFLQILEGSRLEVLNLYGRIASDLRHEGIKTLIKQQNSERLFADWSMSYKEIDDADLKELNNILNWEEIIQQTRQFLPVSNHKIMEIFKKFRFKL